MSQIRNNVHSQRAVGRELALLTRPQNALYSVALVLAVSAVTGAPARSIAAASIATFCILALATTVNNIRDVETDKLNDRTDNPLTRGSIGARHMQSLLGIASVLLLVCQFWLRQPASLICCLALLSLVLAYSLPPASLKKRGLLATLTLSLCYGGLPLVLAASQGTRLTGEHVLWLVGLQVLLLSASLLAKDYKDVKGDRLTGQKTPLILYGKKGVWWITAACTLMAAVLTLALPLPVGARLYALLLVLLYGCCALLLHKRRQKNLPILFWHAMRACLLVLTALIIVTF